MMSIWLRASYAAKPVEIKNFYKKVFNKNN